MRGMQLTAVFAVVCLQATGARGQAYGLQPADGQYGSSTDGVVYPDVAYPHPSASADPGPLLRGGSAGVPNHSNHSAVGRYPLGQGAARLPAPDANIAIGSEPAWNDGRIAFPARGPECGSFHGSCDRPPETPAWFGAAYGLLMQRSAGELQFITDDLGAGTSVLSNRDAAYDYQGGTEVRFGRRLGGCWAVEATWWSLFDASSMREVWGADHTGLATRLDFEGLEIDQGGGTSTVNSYYDFAENHRVARSFAATNVELNLLCVPLNCLPANSCAPCASRASRACRSSALSLSWNVGFRYLALEEGFRFWADGVDGVYGDPLDEIYYNIDVENKLYGAQAGGHMFYCVSNWFSIFSDVNAGLFGNQVYSAQRISNPEGYAYANNGTHLNQDYHLRSSDNGVSVVAELRLGSHVQMTPRWRTTFAYRLMGISGVALPEDQIPDYFDDYSDARRIRNDGAILLHGFMFGIEHRF